MASSSLAYQHVVVRGPPYDRGFSHGQQARAKILSSLEHYHKPGKLLPWDVSLRIINEVYLPGIKKYFPEALSELQGIADGASIDLNEILFLNARYDLARVRGSSIRPCPSKADAPSIASTLNSQPNGNQADQAGVRGLSDDWKYLNSQTEDAPKTGGTQGVPNGTPKRGDDEQRDLEELQECTSAGFLAESTANGDVILAQNWDMSANIYLKDTAIFLEIHPDSSEDLPVMFVTTEAGQLGRSGMNSAGLAVCASSLMSTEDYFPLDLTLPPGSPQKPLLPMSLVRRQFLHNTNFANALVNIRNSPRHLSNKLVVGTADSFVMGLEITPSTVHLDYPSGGDDFVVHANHFTTAAFHAGQWQDRYPGGSSWFRAVQVARRIRAHKQGSLTPGKITQAFCDHLSLPSSVCQHMEDCTVKNVPDYPYKGAQTTLAHLRYNLTKRTAVVCKGPPCMGEFKEYSLPVTSNLGKHEGRHLDTNYVIVDNKLQRLDEKIHNGTKADIVKTEDKEAANVTPTAA